MKALKCKILTTWFGSRRNISVINRDEENELKLDCLRILVCGYFMILPYGPVHSSKGMEVRNKRGL